MNALDELEDARLSHYEEQRFIGILSNMFDQCADGKTLDRSDWTRAIELTKKITR